MEPIISIILLILGTAIVLTIAESWKRWAAFIFTGLLVLSGLVFLVYSYFRFGEYDMAWYMVFMILALVPLVPISILSTLTGRWLYTKYRKQKQG